MLESEQYNAPQSDLHVSEALDEIELNRVKFKVEPLQPFGYRFIPINGSINLQDWALTSLKDVIEMTKEYGIVVIKDAHREDGQQWAEIKPRDIRWAQLPHSDFQGEVSLLMWSFDKGQRNPTDFVPLKDALNAMRAECKILSSKDDDLKNCFFSKDLRALYESLRKSNANFDINSPNELMRKLYRDQALKLAQDVAARYGGYSTIFPGLEFLTSFIQRQIGTNQKSASNELEPWEKCRKLLTNFHYAVSKRLQKITYSHNWTAHPKSGLLAYNKLEQETNKGLLHYANTTSRVLNQAKLWRAYSEGKDIRIK